MENRTCDRCPDLEVCDIPPDICQFSSSSRARAGAAPTSNFPPPAPFIPLVDPPEAIEKAMFFGSCLVIGAVTIIAILTDFLT